MVQRLLADADHGTHGVAASTIKVCCRERHDRLRAAATAKTPKMQPVLPR